MPSDDQLPDSASFWNDVREHFSKRRFTPTPAIIYLNGNQIHETPTVHQARGWLKSRIKKEHPKKPGNTESWLVRAMTLGYVVRRKADDSKVNLV